MEGLTADPDRTVIGKWATGKHSSWLESVLGNSPLKNWFDDACLDQGRLFNKNVVGHAGCVNACEFSADGSLAVSGGDDQQVFLWRVVDLLSSDQSAPKVMDAEHASNIFTVALTEDNSRVLSGGNDQKVIIHDTQTGQPLDYLLHEGAVYAVASQPAAAEVVASACHDGAVRLFDGRVVAHDAVVEMTTRAGAFHDVTFQPGDGRVLATAHSAAGCQMWDVRRPSQPVARFDAGRRGAMSVQFDASGRRLLCLRVKDYPVVFDAFHVDRGGLELRQTGYLNAQTMKRGCFAGEADRLAVSGSDDAHVYVWYLPDDRDDHDDPVGAQRDSSTKTPPAVAEARLVLAGHRSIVNNARYSGATRTLATCGVEKIVKLWSPMALPQQTVGAGGRRRSAALAEDVALLAYFNGLAERGRAGLDSSDDSDDFDVVYAYGHEYTSSSSSSSSASSPPFLGSSPSSSSSSSSSPSPPSPPLRLGPAAPEAPEAFGQRDPFAGRVDPTDDAPSAETDATFRRRPAPRRQYRRQRSSSSSSASSPGSKGNQ